MTGRFARLGLRFPAVSAIVVALSLANAHAENASSEHRGAAVPELRKPESIRKSDGELDRLKSTLRQEATVERANEVRKLLKVRAMTYESLDDFDRAEVEYKDFVNVKPVDPAVYLDRGYFYMRQNLFDAALKDFMAGSRLAPTQPSFNYAAGRALVRMGDHAAAIAQYSEAIRLAPGDSDAVLSRAEAYARIEMHAQARTEFDRAIALGLRNEADRFVAYFGRGYANIRLGDNAAAVSDLDIALSMRPAMATALVWRGYARERLGQRRRALSDYEAALQVNPTDIWIQSSIRRVRA